MRVPPPGPLDLVVRGGRVVDPSSGVDGRFDIGIRLGRIVAIEPDIADGLVGPPADGSGLGTQVLDVAGSIVAPGFVDLHAHVYVGVCPLTSPADPACRRAGVTTVVSAGDAGAHTIDGFRRLVVERSLTRVLAFVHISTIGLAGWPVPEAAEPGYLDADAAARAAWRHADLVVGIKVRMSASITGYQGLLPLQRALEAAEQVGLPVMVHIGGAEAPLADLLGLLRPGDIVTHCFTGTGHGLVDGDAVVDAAGPARERGVLFDVGHGAGSFDFTIAEAAAAAGFWPDVISTDLHSLSAAGTMVDLPTTMAKLLWLGMPLPDVLAAVTSRPAAAIRRSDTIGRLAVGAEADITVFDLVDEPLAVADTMGHERRIDRQVRIRHTVRAGQPWDGPYTHPGPFYDGPPAAG
ncbi:MAG TPA: amidohydrolase/deacetylase family metallohydrolase [Acidimicrobiales bacterium]